MSKQRLPAIKPVLPTGTYVRLAGGSTSDVISSTTSSDVRKNNIFRVGAKQNIYPETNLVKNQTNKLRGDKNYYSGPMVNLNTGAETFVTSALVEEISIKDPDARHSHIPEGTKILLMQVPALTEECAGKMATVGPGGLSQNFPVEPDTYGGVFFIEGEEKPLKAFGMRVKLVEVPATTTKCIHPDCNAAPDNYFATCDKHTKEYVNEMWSVCESDKCDHLTNHKETKCEKHGGQDYKAKRFKVLNPSDVIPDLGFINGIVWPDDKLKKAISAESWGDWAPMKGHEGELVWKIALTQRNGLPPREILILKFASIGGDKYAAFDTSGLELMGDMIKKMPKFQVSSSPEQEFLDAISNMMKKDMANAMQHSMKQTGKLSPTEELLNTMAAINAANDALAKTAEAEVIAEMQRIENLIHRLLADEEEEEKRDSFAFNNAVQSLQKTVPAYFNPEKERATIKEVELNKEVPTLKVSGNVKVSDIVKERPMANESMKDKLIKTVKADSSEAAIRLAGRQFRKATQQPLVAFLAGNLTDDSPAARKKVADFLATEVGGALVSFMLSAGLSAVPDGMMGTLPAKLAKELRVEGMAGVGDVIADVIMAPLRTIASSLVSPDLQEAIAAPALEEQHAPVIEVEMQDVVGVGSNR